MVAKLDFYDRNAIFMDFVDIYYGEPLTFLAICPTLLYLHVMLQDVYINKAHKTLMNSYIKCFRY